MMMITLMMIVEGRENNAFPKKSEPNEIPVRVTRDI